MKQERGERRQETGDRRQETGEGRGEIPCPRESVSQLVDSFLPSPQNKKSVTIKLAKTRLPRV